MTCRAPWYGPEILRHRSGQELLHDPLKHGEIFAYDYQTMDDVTRKLPYFLEEIYNRRRLGCLSSHAYETLTAQSAA